VGRDRQPIHTSGGMKPGMTVVPDYGFADAPAPDVVVVGAQSGDDQLGPWLRKVNEQHALIMSVCTGAFRVAQAGSSMASRRPLITPRSSASLTSIRASRCEAPCVTSSPTRSF